MSDKNQQPSLQELKQELEKLQHRKAALEKLGSQGKQLTTAGQAELDKIAVRLVELEDAIDDATMLGDQQPQQPEPEKPEAYKPAKGTEKLVHAKIVRGRRFNPLTGVEETKPVVQMFTLGEWLLFQKAYKSLGFTIVETLHNPYEK